MLTKAISITALTLGLGMTVTGCSTIKQSVGDNSLDYTKTRTLEPILLPAEAQTQPFVPLYNVPQSGTNTLKLENDKGKRFELPRPVSSVK